MRSPISLYAVSAVVLLASLAGAETLTVPLNIEGARIFVTVRVNDKTARLLLDSRFYVHVNRICKHYDFRRVLQGETVTNGLAVHKC